MLSGLILVGISLTTFVRGLAYLMLLKTTLAFLIALCLFVIPIMALMAMKDK